MTVKKCWFHKWIPTQVFHMYIPIDGNMVARPGIIGKTCVKCQTRKLKYLDIWPYRLPPGTMQMAYDWLNCVAGVLFPPIDIPIQEPKNNVIRLVKDEDTPKD